MVIIRIIGTTPPCARCERAAREAAKAAERFPGQVEVLKIDALSPEAEAFGLLVTPGVAVGDELIASGKVVPADALAKRIQTLLGG